MPNFYNYCQRFAQHIHRTFRSKLFAFLLCFSLIFTVATACNICDIQAQTMTAEIIPDDESTEQIIVQPEIFGGFIEFIFDVINGPFGMCAEEITHRGFDRAGMYNGIAASWLPFGQQDALATTTYRLDTGGYNRRGVYAQTIIRNDSSKSATGVKQSVIITGNVSHTFYVYARGDARSAAMKILTADGSKELFSHAIRFSEGRWQKTEVNVPIIPVSGQVIVAFLCEGAGWLQLDEASLMADDNVAGIRREIADAIKDLSLPLLRYPGGCFSDQEVFQWEYGIGDRDQRTSPIMDWVDDYQRMDFGTDEFMKFCEYIGAKPQLTINFGSSSPQDAANYIEYCNGSTASKFGAMRATNGYPYSYNVQYVEIGNEQYGEWEIGHTTPEKYAEHAIQFSRAIKQISPNIISMFNGDTWGFDWSEKVVTTAQKEIDLLSIHFGTGYGLDTVYSSDLWYKLLVSDSKFNNKWMGWLQNSLNSNGFATNKKIAVTEWWQRYNSSTDSLLIDRRFGSLSSGLWNALTYMHMVNWSHLYYLSNRTLFAGIYSYVMNPATQKRILYKNPAYYANVMIRPFGGGILQPLKIYSDTYNFQEEKDIPFIDAASVSTADSIYIALVNRHPDSAISVKIPSSFLHTGKLRRTLLYSDHYTDCNEVTAPERIKPATDYPTFNGAIVLPQHSFTVIAAGTKTQIAATSDTIDKIDIYPLPADNSIKIDILKNNFNGFAAIEVVNILGANTSLSQKIEIQSGKASIFLDAKILPVGQYFAKITIDGKIILKRFVVLH